MTRAWSLPVGRIGGVAIRAHVSFVVLLLAVAGLAAAAGVSVVGEVGWLVALFGCVVVHELAHARAARRRGVGVTEIELLPIGGLSKLDHLPEDWRAEAAIAAAGPLASLAIGVVLLIGLAGAGVSPLGPALSEGPFLVRLAWVNLLLAGFNLLPALPLDGGRVLRAVLTPRRGRLVATRQVGALGRGIGTAMIVFGAMANPWLLVIGVFVVLGTASEEAAAAVHAALAGTTAGMLSEPSDALPPAMVEAEVPVEDVLDRLAAGPLTVVDHGRAIGALRPETIAQLLKERLR